MRKDLKVIYEGKPMPRMIELLRGTLGPNVKARIKEVLLRAQEVLPDKRARGLWAAHGEI